MIFTNATDRNHIEDYQNKIYELKYINKDLETELAETKTELAVVKKKLSAVKAKLTESTGATKSVHHSNRR